MAQSLIEHVADTAFWVATYRADEGLRADALFSDPLAGKLVEGRGRAIAARMSGAALTAWTVALRTHIIDDYVRTAVADGFDTVLNLGAGLDTRPYRLDLPAQLRWIEVDFDSTISFKEERLAGDTPRCRLERRKVDLSDASARRALLEEIDASSKRILVITEGVIPYLSNAEVAALADDLRRCAHVERWVLEYLGKDGLNVRGLIMRMRRQQLARAPMRFRVRDWHAFFATHGFASREIRYIAVEAQRLSRRAPLPMVLRMLLSILPSRMRESAGRRYGYAVLEKTAS